MALYDDLLLMGATLDHHESDLYILATPGTIQAVKDAGYRPLVFFRSETDGKMWIDVPFAYLPFWPNGQQPEPKAVAP